MCAFSKLYSALSAFGAFWSIQLTLNEVVYTFFFFPLPLEKDLNKQVHQVLASSPLLLHQGSLFPFQHFREALGPWHIAH